MKDNSLIKEILIVLFAAIILGASYAFPDETKNIFLYSVFFLIIIAVNVLVKKYIAYYFEAEVNTKFWSLYHYGFKTGSHFKKPIYMLWFPIFLSLFSKGYFFWMPILEFDIKPRLERIARRHEGMYRFTEMTEKHIAFIVMWGIIANIILAIIGYLLGGYIPRGELFAKLNIYYALWSLVPFGSLDGTKLYFGSHPIWFSMTIITIAFLIIGIMII